MNEMHEAYECKIDKNSMKTPKIIHSMNLNAELVKKFNLTPKFAFDFD